MEPLHDQLSGHHHFLDGERTTSTFNADAFEVSGSNITKKPDKNIKGTCEQCPWKVEAKVTLGAPRTPVGVDATGALTGDDFGSDGQIRSRSRS